MIGNILLADGVNGTKYSTLTTYTPGIYLVSLVQWELYVTLMATYSYYLVMVEAARKATSGVWDMLDDDKQRRTSAYPMNVEIMPGVYPSFADCRTDTKPGFKYIRYLNRRYQFGLDYLEDKHDSPGSFNMFCAKRLPRSIVFSRIIELFPATPILRNGRVTAFATSGRGCFARTIRHSRTATSRLSTQG